MKYMITSSTAIEYGSAKWEINLREKKFDLGCIADILESMLYGRIFAIFSDEYEEKGEPRFMVMAEYQGDVILAACTWRDDGNTVRVISFRSASEAEEEAYYVEAAAFLDSIKY
ncbi:MAG: BrnT family toxin [Proteobacteria bacterium]|nr:BrnT family toxin [Pseudomonadota bacterium]MBU1595471.1 BrnT family toxin [Pseudomonadota bacterium]